MSEQVKVQQNNGRTGKQNRKAVINPYAAKVLALRRVVFEVITEEKLRQILLVVVRMAERGHIPASRLLLAYVVGRLDRPIEVDCDETPEQPAPPPAAKSPPSKAPEGGAPDKAEENHHEQQLKRLHESGALAGVGAESGAAAQDDKLMRLIAGALELPAAMPERVVNQRR